jgi:hypothetical protein
MYPKKLKRSLIISAAMIVLISATTLQITKPYQIRLIEFLTILVLGVAIGVFIVNLSLYLKFRKGNN